MRSRRFREVRREARDAGMVHAGQIDIDHRRRQVHIVKRKPRPRRQQHSGRSDHRPAVVNRPPGFVAQEVRIDVAHAERPRAFQDEPPANVHLAEREMAGTGVENHIHARQRQLAAGAVGDPGIFADFKPDLHVAAGSVDQVVVHIAQRIGPAVPSQLGLHAGGPGPEPAGFVVDAVTRQKPLDGQPAMRPSHARHAAS